MRDFSWVHTCNAPTFYVLLGSHGCDQEGQEEKAVERRRGFCISGPHSPQPLQGWFGFSSVIRILLTKWSR